MEKLNKLKLAIFRFFLKNYILIVSKNLANPDKLIKTVSTAGSKSLIRIKSFKKESVYREMIEVVTCMLQQEEEEATST